MGIRDCRIQQIFQLRKTLIPPLFVIFPLSLSATPQPSTPQLIVWSSCATPFRTSLWRRNLHSLLISLMSCCIFCVSLCRYIDCRIQSQECSNTTGTQLRLVKRSNDPDCWNDETCDPFETIDTLTLSGLGRQAGIYFYIDNNDVAVVANDKVLDFYPVGSDSTNLTATLSIDLTSYMVSDADQITSAFPGWDGLVWWETNAGKVGTINLDTGTVGVWEPPEGIDLDLCPGVNCPTGIVKGIAVDESGTYVITNSVLAKFQATVGSETPDLLWSFTYDRGSAIYNCSAPGCGSTTGEPTGMKPGMQSWGSGTSAKLFGENEDMIGIANNADVQIEINVVDRTSGELLCELPMFEANMSAVTTSFVGYKNMLFGVNNFGMIPGISVPSAPGFFRVDVESNNSGGYNCVPKWFENDQTNTGCLKFSTDTAIVYNNVNSYSLRLNAVVEFAINILESKGLGNLVPLLEYIANFFSDNFVLARDYETACVRYKYDLNDGRSYRGLTLGELNGWTYFVSNQIGPAGELYVGTLGALKVLYDPTN
mmetsp:Transcript_28070/g.65598  ORF Transcript_28070/g.65598 Transcript_28070/m.65598 type:complete len:539 (-) Transcript_28070:212-1828(-)